MLTLRTLLCLLPAVVCLTMCSPSPQEAGVAHAQTDDSLVVLFTGDLLLDRGVRIAMAAHPADWLLADVAPVLRSADATVANLECPLTPMSTPLGKRYVFRGDTCMASLLRKGGITHATLANNHSNDQGDQGLQSTLSVLSRAGIVPMGCDTLSNDSAHLIAPTLISKAGLHVALFPAVLLNLENWMLRPGALSPIQPSLSLLTRSIRTYSSQHPSHRIVCILHWGVEFQPHASLTQISQATVLAHAGADAIIGHHPHVVQPPRPQDPIPTYYSLGGFVFDQHHPLACRGAVARIVVRQDSLSASLLPLRIRSCRPEWDK